MFFVQGSLEERQQILAPYFDLDELQQEFGGNKEWTFDADIYIDNILKAEKDTKQTKDKKTSKKKENGEKQKKEKKAKKNSDSNSDCTSE